eukprot:COSAG06_NODE_6474_length_2920_cov_1.616094_1_plen_82_part_00
MRAVGGRSAAQSAPGSRVYTVDRGYVPKCFLLFCHKRELIGSTPHAAPLLALPALTTYILLEFLHVRRLQSRRTLGAMCDV